jgi:hypothetical protein
MPVDLYVGNTGKDRCKKCKKVRTPLFTGICSECRKKEESNKK